jgi:hypothetical protein
MGSCPQISIKAFWSGTLFFFLFFFSFLLLCQTRRWVMGKQERVTGIERQEGERHKRDCERQWAETMEEFKAKALDILEDRVRQRMESGVRVLCCSN